MTMMPVGQFLLREDVRPGEYTSYPQPTLETYLRDEKQRVTNLMPTLDTQRQAIARVRLRAADVAEQQRDEQHMFWALEDLTLIK